MRIPALWPLITLCVYTQAKQCTSLLDLPSRGDVDTTGWKDAYVKARLFVSRMTLAEKVNISRGYPSIDNTCVGNTGSIPRLNWHGLCIMDASNGVRATDMVTAWPSGIHVGASWDRDLAYDRTVWMAREFRKKGVNVLLGPSAGPLGRVPVGGRNWEGFSVDPYLAGQLLGQTTKGIQGAGVIATLKHLIANEQETYRRPYFGVEAISSNIDDKTMHEYYLWPFADGVKAGAASVMCSYNRVNNTYACDNSKVMNDLLKGELSFQGFVMLDWNAQHTTQSANAGLDMVMPGVGSFGDSLLAATRNETVPETRVSDMAVRILAAWYLAGQDCDFPTPGIGMKNLTISHDPIDARDPRSKPTSLEAAVAGHVLVKNVNRTLPFTNFRMISVFGYDAAPSRVKNTGVLFDLGYYSFPEMAQAELGTRQNFDQAAHAGTIVAGGRAGANSPAYIIDPLSAIQQRCEQDDTWINWDLDSEDPSVNTASEACVVFINAFATEGWDREGLHDDYSDALVRNVASKCANTIVVIHNAGIRLVDQWIEHPNVTATIFAHLPGQDSGRALVKLLWGEENFSGKLPYTVAKNESDYNVYDPCGRGDGNTTNLQCDFSEGTHLDYRHFDARNITPRYEFGFGLSYTRFEYKNISIEYHDTLTSGTDLWQAVVSVRICVENIGPIEGAEVVQLYIGFRSEPIKKLRGFAKIHLTSGQAGTVEMNLTRRDLSSWDVVKQAWIISDAEREILVGASSRDIRLHRSLLLPESQREALQAADHGRNQRPL